MKKYVFLFIGSALVATVGIAVKLNYGSIHPMVINFYRVFFALLVLGILCPLYDKKTFFVNKKDLLMYSIIGLIFACMICVSNMAFMYAPVQNVEFIYSFSPFFVLMFAYFILKEKITVQKIVTLIISIIGISIINPVQNSSSFGNILALFLAAIDGVLITLLRREDKVHTIGDVFWFFFFAMIFLMPFPFVYGFGDTNLMTMFLGVVSTGLAYFFFNLGLEEAEAETGSIFMAIVSPIFAITLATLILGEAVTQRAMIGGFVLIGSIVYLNIHSLKISKESQVTLDSSGP